MKNLRRRLNPRHRFGGPAERRAALAETIQRLELLADPGKPQRERRQQAVQKMTRFAAETLAGAADSLQLDQAFGRKPDPMGAVLNGLARAGLQLFVGMLPQLFPQKPKAKRRRRRRR